MIKSDTTTPLCKDAWAIPPSHRMLKNGNDYYTCSKCGKPVATVDLKESIKESVTDTTAQELKKAINRAVDDNIDPIAGGGEIVNWPLLISDLTTLFDTYASQKAVAAITKELERLEGFLGIAGLCENDSDMILTWVGNAKWALIAPPGKNTESEAQS